VAQKDVEGEGEGGMGEISLSENLPGAPTVAFPKPRSFLRRNVTCRLQGLRLSN